MPINQTDGRFSVGYWLDADSDDEEDSAEYGETVDEVRARAITVIAAGRYRYAILYKQVAGEWDEIERITLDDVSE